MEHFMTTPQARCEQIAREITQAFYRGETGFVSVEKAITTSLLAAEERGRQEADKKCQDGNRKLLQGWTRIKDLLTAGFGPEECFRFRDCAEKEKGRCVETVIAYLFAIIHDRDKYRQQVQKSEPARECVEIAEKIASHFVRGNALTDLRDAFAAALQAERDKLASVEESARRVIEQAVQVLATRPITGERHTVLTALEAWLAEHLVPVKPCPEGDDVQRESAEKP